EGVCTRRDDAHAALVRERVQAAAQLGDLVPRLPDVPTDARARLDDGLVHLRTHPLAQELVALPPLDQLAHVRPELARLRVDDLELLFDAQRELAVEKTFDGCHTIPLPALVLVSILEVRAAPSRPGGRLSTMHSC